MRRCQRQVKSGVRCVVGTFVPQSSDVGGVIGVRELIKAWYLVLLVVFLVWGVLVVRTSPALAAGHCPNEALRAENSSLALAECRAYEQVTPKDKNGAVLDNVFLGYVPPQVANDGERVIAPAIQCFASPESCTGNRKSEGDPYSFVRTPSGWETHPLAPPAIEAETSSWYSINANDGTALFAIDLEALDETDRRGLLEHAEVVSLREAGALLAPAEAGLAAYMVALLNWHRRHRFCANCGAPTRVAEAGLSRLCDNCGASHFPRTDPVVIMLVEHNGHLLLGSRSGWPESRFSILAGFVAPGETPEEAVVREVFEESGIAAHSPRYVTSQPWPFPSSLMLGFDAWSDGGEPSAHDGELTRVGWFSRREVRDAQAGSGEIQLPGEVSIARLLIDRWAARD